MKQILKYILPSLLLLFFVACGGKGKKEKNADLSAKKADLASLKKERDQINSKISSLEDAIADQDPTGNREKLVSISPITTGDFSHYVELQGKVDAENISYISPRGMGGQVKAIYITKGNYVKTGQLVLKLDDAIIRKNITAAKQSMQVIQSQLNMAKTVYDRQKNLWDQNIGSEIQVIQAKTSVESLEAQIRTVQENVKVAEEQLKTTTVYSDVSGYLDEVNVRVGELFQGVVPGLGAQIKVINTSSLKVVVTVPENHIGRIGKGARVQILIPDLNKTIENTISFTSQSIDPNQRGYIAEIKIPYDARLKPNQVAQVKILDYAAPTAVTVPVNIVQTDDKGKYVFVAIKSSNNKLTAQKRPVSVGEFYNDQIEIKAGLLGGDNIITEGYQDLYDGQAITTGIK
jgi:membrane fusion protein, multidrug efflux system